ncbi:MAG: beta-ketoacyl-ACP synthase II [Gammaproteobacteria bacterium]|nr:beta-ketoacyl-ACP synthase II [Gammaproteobacteria bacterium]MCZ6723610.1 beta-ketoacyl-ACP synthase II [Gammaproteobacteria bacterium]
MSKRRVVITGLGLLTPVGNTVEESWRNIVAGKSGIAPITSFDASEFSVRISGSVKNFDPLDYIAKKEVKKMDAFIHYGLAAGIQALDDSGIEVTDANAERIGVAIGSGIGGLPTIEKNRDAYLQGGPRKISPFFVPSSIINMVSGNLSIMRGLKGPNIAIVSACTTGAHNIGDSARMIVYGDADIMVAGGAEMGTCALGVGGFAAARALSTRNDDPEAASRPWDRDRDGFVLGDGAGVVVLEEYELAKKRGAHIYCELVGYGMSGDAYHMTSPSKGGEGAARCMKNAMNDAGLNAEDIGYINAHGTSTPAGDIAETNAVKLAMGDHAYKLVVSSTKSMTGHLLGAAGGIEAIFSILALRDQVIPPTINLDNPGPECDLDFVANTARDLKLNFSMSNSFGFGGTNGTCIFKKI